MCTVSRSVAPAPSPAARVLDAPRTTCSRGTTGEPMGHSSHCEVSAQTDPPERTENLSKTSKSLDKKKRQAIACRRYRAKVKSEVARLKDQVVRLQMEVSTLKEENARLKQGAKLSTQYQTTTPHPPDHGGGLGRTATPWSVADCSLVDEILDIVDAW